MNRNICDALNNAGWNYKSAGNNQFQLECPYCQGDVFYINQDSGQYKCHKGNCSRSGNMETLNIDFPELKFKSSFNPKPDYKRPVKKTYQKPNDNMLALTSDELTWLKSRGLSDKAIKENKLYHVDRADGYTIAIPFYRNGELIMNKYRSVAPDASKGKEISSNSPEFIFWNMDNCSPGNPLIITEGMIDAMSLITAGFNNVASLPSGVGNLKCIDNCWEWLERFEEIIIYTDDDQPGKECYSEIICRVASETNTMKIVEHPEYCKDANDVLMKHGKDELIDVINNAYVPPVEGLVNAQTVSGKPETIETVDSLIWPLKQALNGYEFGALTLWTGDSGCGKSTVLFNEVGAALRDKQTVCIYSGEFNTALIKRWIYMPIAGKGGLEQIQLRFRQDYCLKPEIEEKIDSVYGDELKIIDESSLSIDRLMSIFEMAYKRNGAKVFIIDNLMSLNISTNHRDTNHDQTEAIKKIANFVQKFQVHLHLVAHQSKSQFINAKNTVSGTKNLTNIAWNIVEVVRLNKEERDKYFDERVKSGELKADKTFENVQKHTPDGWLNVWKNRIHGDEPKQICFNFYWNSRRIVWVNYGNFLSQADYEKQASDYGLDRNMLDNIDIDEDTGNNDEIDNSWV